MTEKERGGAAGRRMFVQVEVDATARADQAWRLEFRWFMCRGTKVEDFITSTIRQANKAGLLLLQIPTGRRPRPFSPPLTVRVAEPLRHAASLALRRQLGFVREGYGEAGERMMHELGVAFASEDASGFLWTVNRLQPSEHASAHARLLLERFRAITDALELAARGTGGGGGGGAGGGGAAGSSEAAAPALVVSAEGVLRRKTPEELMSASMMWDWSPRGARGRAAATGRRWMGPAPSARERRDRRPPPVGAGGGAAGAGAGGGRRRRDERRGAGGGVDGELDRRGGGVDDVEVEVEHRRLDKTFTQRALSFRGRKERKGAEVLAIRRQTNRPAPDDLAPDDSRSRPAAPRSPSSRPLRQPQLPADNMARCSVLAMAYILIVT